MKMPVLLIVDDEKPTRDALRMGFQDDYEVYTAANLSQASALLQEESPDLVLTDLRLGGESGMDVLKAAASLPHPPQSIMMTAYGSVDAAVAAMKEGAYDFVTKPLNLDAVELVLKRALHTRNLETANQELTTRIQADSGLQKLLGRSAAMEHVFSIIRQVAPSKTTVLIEGESGTGTNPPIGSEATTRNGRQDSSGGSMPRSRIQRRSWLALIPLASATPATEAPGSPQASIRDCLNASEWVRRVRRGWMTVMKVSTSSCEESRRCFRPLVAESWGFGSRCRGGVDASCRSDSRAARPRGAGPSWRKHGRRPTPARRTG